MRQTAIEPALNAEFTEICTTILYRDHLEIETKSNFKNTTT
jgi:hypothetical protein